MNRPGTWRWPGFERPPSGNLLEQCIDLTGAMGIAYERSVDFHKAAHVHDRHMLVCPRGGCRMSVGTPGKRYTVDGTRVLWVPRDLVHDNRAISAVYDTLALYPSAALMARALGTSGLAAAEAHALATTAVLLRKSPWLDELLDHYFALRVLARSRRRREWAFFESQLLAELLRLRQGGPSVAGEAPRDFDDAGDDTATRALRHIEANLFSPLRLPQIARQAHASVATLLRAFRSQYGQTPHAYIRRRRLDEAMHLIEGGDHRVTDVALIVGYEDLAAFSKAFHQRFGKPPSAFLPRRRTR